MPSRIHKRDLKLHLTKSTYRKKALKYLREDFEDRCAYSMVHWNACGKLEVDHFYPKGLNGEGVHAYSNLMLASKHCNSAKWEYWPSKKEQEKGLRFIDPTREIDYGVHIFEDDKTGTLYPATMAGLYQILKCKLNSTQLKESRQLRTNMLTLKKYQPVFAENAEKWGELIGVLEVVDNIKFIPPIPQATDELKNNPQVKRWMLMCETTD